MFNDSASPLLFSNAFDLSLGDVVSVIGCGGKTSLVNHLALENRRHQVLISTTTKILPPAHNLIDFTLKSGQSPKPGINLLCEKEGHKLKGVPLNILKESCPTDGITLLEADGSKCLPLKGWAEYEPVVPAFTTLTIGIVTLWAVGLPCDENIVHRLPLFQAITSTVKGEYITLEHVAKMISHERGMFQKAVGKKILFINQVEDEKTFELAQGLAKLLQKGRYKIAVGSIKRKKVTLL